MKEKDNPADSGAVRAGHNSAFLLGSQLISKLAGFAGVILLARILNVDDFGVLALALAVTGIVSLFVELGLDQLIIREVAQDRNRIPTLFTNALLIKAALALTALITTIIVIDLSGLSTASSPVIIILTIAMIPAGLYHTLVALFMGLEKMAYTALANSLGELLRLGLMALVLLAGYGLEGVAWTYVASISIMAVAMAAVAGVKVRGLLAIPDAKTVRSMALEALPFMFLGLFFVVYFKIDFIMLAWMKDETSVGSYAAAYRLMESLLFVPAAFMGAVYPTLSRISSAGKEAVLNASGKTLRYMAMIGIPVGFGVTMLAEKIIFLFFGDAYAESVLPLRIIIWAMVLIFLNCVCPVGLNSIGRQTLNVLVTGAGIVVNITLNLFLIPYYGAVGTSIATTVTELVTTALLLFFFARNIGRLRLLPEVYRPVIAGAVMAACLFLLDFLPLGALIPLGAAVYLTVLVLLRALGRADLDLALSLARPSLRRQDTPVL